MKRRGFTLLELVISCAMLVGLFSTLALMMTRAHRLRADDEDQARLLARGRALLDRLSDEIRNTCGTNLTPAREMRTVPYEFSFVRAKGHPRGTRAGDAPDDMPFERITYSFDGTTGGFAKAASAWTPSEESPGTTNYATEYRFISADGDVFTVTNVRPATDKTIVRAASKGDTITIPVTSGSTKRVYDTVSRGSVHVDIVPTDSPFTNRVLATVTFTNGFSSVVTNAIRRPPGVRWPEARSGRARVNRRLDLFAETRTNECGLLPLVLLYTNSVSALAVTNVFAYAGAPGLSTNSPSSGTVATNVPTGMTATNKPPPYERPGTNIVASTVWFLTNISSGASSEASAVYPEGMAIFLAGEPVVLTNLWRTDGPPAPANGAPRAEAPPGTDSAMTPAAPAAPEGGGRTNVLAGTGVRIGKDDFLETIGRDRPAAIGGPGGSTNTMDGISVGIGSADLFAFERPLVPPSVGGNLIRDLIPPMDFENDFAATASSNGPALPLVLYRKELVRAPADRTNFLYEASGDATAISLAGGDDAPVIRSLGVSRKQDIDLETGFVENASGTDFTTICSSTFLSVSTFRLQMDVPSSMAGTNRHEYLQDDSERVWKGTRRSKDTTWETIVLDDDSPGTAIDLPGLWLHEATRKGSRWKVEKEDLFKPVPPKPVKTDGKGRPDDATASCVAQLRFIPLAFRKDGDQFALAVWDPSDDGSEPPVCVDVYLELISPVHKRRAMALPSPEKRAEYVNRHLVRMTRRIPLNRRNLWRPPR